MKFENLVGKKFGRLTVVELLPRVRTPKGVSQVKYLCECECGNTVEVFAGNLRKGNTKSCGCFNSEEISKRELIDLTGKKFGRLTVIGRAKDSVSKNGNASPMWNCVCDCGANATVNGNSLRRGKQLSCGCLMKEIVSEKQRIDLTGKRFGKLVAISWFVDNTANKRKIKWLCECDCGNTTSVITNHLINGWTKSCGCLTSTIEEKITSLLSRKNICFKTQYSFGDLVGKNGGKLRFDYALFNNDSLLCLIEAQGRQHFKEVGDIEFGKYQREYTDAIKKEYCNNNGIQLFEIAYNDNIEVSVNNILSMLYDNPVPSEQSSKV